MTKREQIINMAGKLFLHHGFRKVSVDELCRKAGVSRKTFYTYFKNKNDLVLYLLMEMVETGFERFHSIINEDITFAQKLQKLILMKEETSKNWSMEFVSDLYSAKDDEIFTYYMNASQKSLRLFEDWLKKGQLSGEIDKNLNLEYINWLLRMMMEHFSSPELKSIFRNAEDMVRQVSHIFVYGISTPEMK